MPPRAAIRFSLNGKHDGWGRFGKPSGANIYVMGIAHVEFGPWGVSANLLYLMKSLFGNKSYCRPGKERVKKMKRYEMEKRIVRYGELIPCKTAFIDAHTPGSDRKENFTIIGGGVSESPDQHIHIKDTPGFNIGAAGQPPRCRNSLHSHRTAEVFLSLIHI